MGEVGSAYAGVRQRITALVADADPSTVVPACPRWTVKDVVAHVTGVLDDASAGRLGGVGTDPWTAAQVDARRGRTLAEILDEWASKSAAFEALLDAVGSPGAQALFDVTTHEHDLRGALRRPGAQDCAAVSIALRWLAPMVAANIVAAGLPPLRLRTTGGDGWCGGDPAAATVTASPFELLRAVSGRRSRSQLRALQWDGDPDVYLDALAFGPFSIPAQDVVD